MQQMQHDARARGAYRVAERDGAAVDVEFSAIELAQRTVQAQLLAAVLVLLPRREAAEHLGRERFVDLPGIEVVELEAVALEYRCRGVHRSETHLRRIQARPLRIDDPAERLQIVALHGLLGGEHQPRRAVGDLRGISGGDVAVLPVEKGFELRKILGRRILSNAVIVPVEVSLVVDRRDFRRQTVMRVAECAALLRANDAGVALRGVFVHLAATDPETISDILGRLTHEKAHVGVGQAFHDADDGREQLSGFQFQEHAGALEGGLRGHVVREPNDHGFRVEERHARERVHAAREDQVRAPREHVGYA